MRILTGHPGDIFTLRSGDTEFVLRVLDVGNHETEIGIEHDESVHIVPETCVVETDVRLAVYPR